VLRRLVEEFLGSFVFRVTDLILDARWETNREAMTASVARAFAGIEAEQLLTSQVVFNRLEDGR